ncbi:MAG: hypothetical protein Q6J33_01015 [Gloeomargarita sp. DG_2_bins_126]
MSNSVKAEAGQWQASFPYRRGHNSQPTAIQMSEEAAQAGQASTVGATWGRIK